MKLKQVLVAMIRNGVHNGDSRITVEFFERAEKCGIIDEDWVTLHSGKPAFHDDAHCCDHCDGWFTESLKEVRANPSRIDLKEKWCYSCILDDATLCAGSNLYFSEGFQMVQVAGERVCYEYYSDELYYWDSDGEYHWESEPDETEPDSVVPDYHSVSKPWRSGKVYTGKEIPWEFIGAELEVKVNDADSLGDVVEKAEALGLIAEKDGSLDGVRGIEIIGPPLPFKKYRTGDVPWNAMLSELREIGTRGWDAGTGYGIHLSVNKAGMSKLHNAKFCYFINSNKKLCERVAGRSENSWALYVDKKLSRSHRYTGAKYEAASNRSERRTEVRIFRSTLKWESFLKNVEFVHAALRFTHDCSAAKLKTGEFIRFFRNHRKTYSHLDEWLRNRDALVGLEE